MTFETCNVGGSEDTSLYSGVGEHVGGFAFWDTFLADFNDTSVLQLDEVSNADLQLFSDVAGRNGTHLG